MLPKNNPMETMAWQKLTTHFLSMQASHLRELFAEDPERFQKFHLLLEDILGDYSKNIITQETAALLIELAEECQLKEAIDAIFQGIPINLPNDRPLIPAALPNRST